jgi:hypothetical protein
VIKVDITEYAESKNINVDIVKKSPTKIVVFLDGGHEENVTFENKTTKKVIFQVSIDGKIKNYTPNQDSIQNLARSWTFKTDLWISKKAQLNVLTVKGREMIIATPINEEVRI